MLPTRKHAGKAICYKSPRRLPKGLSEIEEIDREEMSIKMMQALERFMRKYPAVWSEASVQHLLVEIADTQYARSENSDAEERLHTVIMGMLVPMAKIMEVEQESVKVEKQKIQEATLALQRVQVECQYALADLTKEHDRSARDLEELGKALEENRVAAEEAGRKLSEKENQIHLLLQQQQDLVIRLICGGPAEFLKWAKDEIQSQGLVDLHSELEHAWWPLTTDQHNKTLNPEAPKCSKELRNTSDSLVEPAYVKTLFVQDPTSMTTGAKGPERETSRCCNQSVYKDGEKPALTNMMMSLLCVAVSETFQQMVESCSRVKGPSSLLSAVAGFWMGLAGRMTCLAMVTMFPQLMHKSRSTSSRQGLVSIPMSSDCNNT